MCLLRIAVSDFRDDSFICVMNSSAGQSLTDASSDLSIAKMLNLAPFIMGINLMLTPKLTFVNSEVLELPLQYLFHYTFMHIIVRVGKYIVNQNRTEPPSYTKLYL